MRFLLIPSPGIPGEGQGGGPTEDARSKAPTPALPGVPGKGEAFVPDMIETESHHRRARLPQWLAMSPLLIWLLAFIVAPTLIMLVYSFCQRDELGQVVFSFTSDNYVRAFKAVYL